jgi:predicted TIM-barrel fold metal-dependent hydrolase
VHYTNTLLQDRILFGSDYPVITPDRWLADFAQLQIKPQVRPKVLKENAVRLLKLA